MGTSLLGRYTERQALHEQTCESKFKTFDDFPYLLYLWLAVCTLLRHGRKHALKPCKYKQLNLLPFGIKLPGHLIGHKSPIAKASQKVGALWLDSM